MTPERLGISDTKGKLFWNEDMGNRGNAHLRSIAGIEVPVTTLDEYFARQRPPGRISFMKVDVEGMEYEVLNGAVGLLAGDHPILYFETLRGMREIVIKRSGKDPFAVLQNLFYPSGMPFSGSTGTNAAWQRSQSISSARRPSPCMQPRRSPTRSGDRL